MKAVILCAGSGGRLYPLTKDKPKCLIRVGEKIILEYAIENLKDVGIQEIILVVGFKQQLVRGLVKEKKYDQIQFVVNERFASTNTAYSLGLAFREIDSDIILINGDVVFDKTILTDLVRHTAKDCVVVDASMPLGEEEIKVICENGKIRKINKGLEPRLCQGEAIGINKISKESSAEIAHILKELEEIDEVNHFFELGIERMCENHGDFGVLFTTKSWAEIDTQQDLDHARRKVFPKIAS